MTIRRSFEMDLLLGLANLMADNPAATVPLWAELSADYDDEAQTYRPNPPQPAGTAPIMLDLYDGDGPFIMLTDYSVDDDVSTNQPIIGVQATLRAPGRDVLKAMTADLYALLHGRWGGMLGPIRLVNASRSSGTGTGQDSSDRLGRTENYYLRVYRPTPNRQD